MEVKMNSMYQHYRSVTAIARDWLYYPHLQDEFYLDTVFKENYARDFIMSYFTAGGKLSAFNWMRNNDLFEMADYRANHTLSAYLFGVFLHEGFHMRLRKGIPMLHAEHKKNFLYFWWLVCLFHDAAFSLENVSDKFIVSCSNTRDFMKFFDIKEYNLLNVIKRSDIRANTNNSALIKNYYLYRADNNKIDHGIAGAILLYDRLMKMYNEAKNNEGIKGRVRFTSSNLRFSREFPKHIRYISEKIAMHNMYRAKPHQIEIYKKYNLHSLIPNENNDHLLSCDDKNSLLFLLGLVDSIEPLKCFNRGDRGLDPSFILENLLCKINSKKFEIMLYSEMPEFESYLNDIENLKKWLNVSINTRESPVKIVINEADQIDDEEVA